MQVEKNKLVSASITKHLTLLEKNGAMLLIVMLFMRYAMMIVDQYESTKLAEIGKKMYGQLFIMLQPSILKI